VVGAAVEAFMIVEDRLRQVHQIQVVGAVPLAAQSLVQQEDQE
jgi:hypothetical protein